MHGIWPKALQIDDSFENSVSARLLVKNRVSQKNRASSRLLAQNRVSQVFWDPIRNRVSPRSMLLKAVYLEALLYLKSIDCFDILMMLVTLP